MNYSYCLVAGKWDTAAALVVVPVSYVSSSQLMTCSDLLLARWFAGYLKRYTKKDTSGFKDTKDTS